MKKIGSKMRSVALILLSVVIVAALALGLAACGSDGDYDEGYDAGYAAGKAEASSSGGSEKTIAATYQLSTPDVMSTEYTLGDDDETIYTMESVTILNDTVFLYTDGTYMAVKTVVIPNDPITDPFMQTDVSIRFGTYTKSTSAVDLDGALLSLDLSAATRVIWMSIVYDGLYIKGVDSDDTSAFPITYVGADTILISRDQFMSDYGSACTYYIVLDAAGNETYQLVNTMGSDSEE